MRYVYELMYEWMNAWMNAWTNIVISLVVEESTMYYNNIEIYENEIIWWLVY